MKETSVRSKTALAVWAILLCFCGVVLAQDVRYNSAQGTDFSKYKTYKWTDIKSNEAPDQIVDQNIRQAVDSQLAAKGLTKSSNDDADLLVAYQTSIDREKQIDAWGAPGWRVGLGGASATTSTISIGTLVLDIYDPAAKQLVWRGYATKTMKPSKDPEKNRSRLDQGIAKLLKNYPPPVK